VINQNRYVRIVSGVGAGATVAERQLIMRLITQNTVLAPGIVAEFGTADAVGAFFGANSEEYKRAQAYFGFVSKSIQSPTLISFARWVNTAIAPMVVGDALPKAIGSFSGFAAGTLQLLIGATTVDIPAINVSASATLTDVAAKVQAALRLNANPQLVTATVTYNTNTNQFVLTGTVTGSGTIVPVATGTADDMSVALGWTTAQAVTVPGQAADTPDQAVAKSADISNNFGSFVLCTPSTPLTIADITAIATWNDTQNNMYIYSLAAKMTDAGAISAAIIGLSGAALNIQPDSGPDFIEQSPCEILAATNYNQVNSTQNFMFYQFPTRKVTVSTDALADQMDSIRANYIGVTQSAGQQLAFYQRGILMGGSQDAVDMNTYSNEIWLKATITQQILSLFLNVPIVPANEIGQAMILSLVQSVITKAKNNGVISPGKLLDEIQKQYINRISGDPMAWRQVQTIGYWITVGFSSYVNQNTKLKEYKATYQLIYSKDDAIRFVDGQDILI
jgi:hypothetical protein